MDNYQYCAKFAAEATHDAAHVLDYGCGAGQLVCALRERGVEGFGCDVFYGGGDYSKQVPEGMWNHIIRPMDEDRIPFPADTFDLVINNQVMEHVPDLDAALAEIRRVLKPGGQLLSVFPHKSVWREGHCGIPFLHWFPKHSRARVGYAFSLRLLGLGANKSGKGRYEWSRSMCEWLDRWTYYRSYGEIKRTYERYFEDIRHLEVQHWDEKLGEAHIASRWLPAPLKRLAYEKLAGLVFVCSLGT